MAPKPLLAELIDIKETISTSDFVQGLVEAVSEDDATQAVRDYVVTERLLGNYDQALGLIKAAMDGHTSKPTYLHGSFGSGKSHFMAVLYALLSGNPAARGRTEFEPVLAKHQWLQTDGKKFLLVPYHMLGAKAMEQRVLGGYVDHVRALHPDAPLPPVYRTDAMFDSLSNLRKTMGDEAVLRALNSSYSDADDEWGDAAFWTSDLLDTAISAAEAHEPGARLNLVDPSTPAEFRAKLVNDAAETLLTGFTRDAAENEHGFISLDAGLSVIADHAKSLGYDGLILFLDELILWLHQKMHDLPFIARETEKMTNFREGGDQRRAIPIVSFIARQRDPRELLGGEASGAYEAAIHDNLNLASGRFDLIELEDRNLPEIAHERLLKPKDDAARAQIEAAFAETKRLRPQVWDTLLGSEQDSTGADEASFKRSYPFSPAFLSTLVQISSDLQRARTGLKLMGQLLADRRANLRLGQLIPLGDLYSVITAGGDRPFVADKKVMFEAADRLYKTGLRPFLLAQYEVTEDDIEQYLHRPDTITDKSLAGRCKQFVGDNQLVGTLLLSALAPGAPALHELTVRRLGALNYGSVTAPIPGLEDGTIAAKVREWAGRFAEIKVGDGADPAVRLELSGVNLESVLANADVNNNRANRAALARRILIEEFGIQPADGRLGADELRFVWRGSSRTVEVVFGNVRDENELPNHDLEPSDPTRWRIVIDLPFDEDDHSAREDANRIRELRQRQQGHPTQTLAWLPDHLSKPRWDSFQRLVKIDKALADPGRFDTQYAAHLNADHRAMARNLLTDQRETLMAQLKAAFKQAYGLADKQDADVQKSFQDHLQPLPDIEGLALPLGQSMADAIRRVAGTLLAHQYPAHPDFDPDHTGIAIKPADAKTVFTHVRKAAEARDGRVDASKDHKIMRRLAVPLGLGEQSEAYFELSRFWADHFKRTARVEGITGDLPVTTLTEWTNLPKPSGLDTFLAHLVVAAFAEMDDRVWVRAGVPLDPAPELHQIKAGDALRTQPAPSEQDWETARSRFETIAGEKPPTLRRGRLVQQFARQIIAFARAHKEAAADLVRQLERHAEFLGLADDGDTGRLSIARQAVALLTAMDSAGSGSASAKQTIEEFARFDLGKPSPERYGAAIKQAHPVADALARAPWDHLEVATDLGPEGETLLESLRNAARTDQFTTDLVAVLADTPRKVTALIRARQPKAPTLPPPPEPRPGDVPLDTDTSHPPVPDVPPTPGANGARRAGSRRTTARAAIADLTEDLADIVDRNPGATIEITWRVIE
jgi:nucleotide-binding universal stress UspA family protein